jgi:hypothetical protein
MVVCAVSCEPVSDFKFVRKGQLTGQIRERSLCRNENVGWASEVLCFLKGNGGDEQNGPEPAGRHHLEGAEIHAGSKMRVWSPNPNSLLTGNLQGISPMASARRF